MLTESADDRVERDARWRSLHAIDAERALADRDPAAIKRLYVEMGAHLEASYAEDVNGVPQLSLSETVPVVTRLLEGASGRLLDAGCGPHPATSIALANADVTRTVVALDLGLGTVRLARSRAARDGVGVLAVVGDLEALPFRDEAFDGVVSDDTVEHVPADRTAIGELLRVARRTAPVVVATPNRLSVSVLARKLRDRMRGKRFRPETYYAAASHLREYSRRDLDRLVAGLGRIDARAAVGWSGSGVRRFTTRLTSRPPLRDLDRMLVIRLRRSTAVRARPDGSEPSPPRVQTR